MIVGWLANKKTQQYRYADLFDETGRLPHGARTIDDSSRSSPPAAAEPAIKSLRQTLPPDFYIILLHKRRTSELSCRRRNSRKESAEKIDLPNILLVCWR
jgi:hypothetical protein